MNTPETAAPADWHECRVTLPAPHNWLVLDLTAERPEEWARAAADEHFSADDTPADWREAFAEDVLWYWAVAARQKALCAAVLAPQDGGVAAFYCVRELGASLPSRCAWTRCARRPRPPRGRSSVRRRSRRWSCRWAPRCACTAWSPRTPRPTAAMCWKVWRTTCCRGRIPPRWSAAFSGGSGVGRGAGEDGRRTGGLSPTCLIRRPCREKCRERRRQSWAAARPRLPARTVPTGRAPAASS